MGEPFSQKNAGTAEPFEFSPAEPVDYGRFKAGQVSSALWENQVQVKGAAVTILKATVQRRYKGRNGEWQSSSSFSRNEIPLAIHCLQKAFEKIIEMQSENSGNGNNNNNVEEMLR